jgi:hypothetical protein
MKNLDKIIEKYSKIEFNHGNYGIGGGLNGVKFASNRHEDAISDKGKLSMGKANQMFKKATGCELELVKEVIAYAVPNPEWHHAGLLPKSYGGGMKKTYFLNSFEIIDIAENWQSYIEKVEISKDNKRQCDESAKNREESQQKFLSENATKVTRSSTKPKYFYETNREMNGKYGWFCSYGKSYKLSEYYTGWEFDTVEKLNEFHNI